MASLKQSDATAKQVYDLDLGGYCVELPLTAIVVDYGGYKVMAPQPVYQCPDHYEVLAHKFDIQRKIMRIALCPRVQKELAEHDTAANKLA